MTAYFIFSYSSVVSSHGYKPQTLTAAGFTIGNWRDVSQASLAWFKDNAPPADAEPPILGFHLLLGPLWPTMAANMVGNIAAGRLAVIQTIVRKPQSLAI